MASFRRYKKKVSVYDTLLNLQRERIQRNTGQGIGASKRRRKRARRKKALAEALTGTRQHSLDSPGASELPSPPPSYPEVPREFQDRVIALDCEMVGVSEGPLEKSALGRCSIVNYEGEVLFDRYVKPSGRIIDYRTAWSGITPRHMRNALPFDEAMSQICPILEDAIIVGHDLKHDFAVLELSHPPSQTRDTSRYLPLRTLACLPVHHPPSLRNLVLKLFNESIQDGVHCSVEDALAVLKVYQRIEKRWEWEASQEHNQSAKPGSSSRFTGRNQSEHSSWLCASTSSNQYSRPAKMSVHVPLIDNLSPHPRKDHSRPSYH